MSDDNLEDFICEPKQVDSEHSKKGEYKHSVAKSNDCDHKKNKSCLQSNEYMEYESMCSRHNAFQNFRNRRTLGRLTHSNRVTHVASFFNNIFDDYQMKKRHVQAYSTRRLQFSIDRSCKSCPIEKCTVVAAIWKAEWIYKTDVVQTGGGLCVEGDVHTVTGSGGGSVRIHHLTGVSPEGRSRFPKLEECAHFHYEHVELGPIQVSLCEDESLRSACDTETNNKAVTVRVTSGSQTWLLRRTYDNFRMLDKQLHRCVYDRKFSNLSELPEVAPDSQENVEKFLSAYMTRLSSIAGSLMNCGPVLSWLELDNRGRRLLVTEGDSCPINTPAVAAAYSIKKYTAVAADEISFDIGDMISVIDMPPPEESAWWRGKRGFLVGFFPSQCVAVITEKLPRNLSLHQSLTLAGPTKPVLRKHGKLIAFFRAFILSRPSRRRLKQSGILKERVFGCDLGEHLLNSGHDIPMVLKCCSEFIESHGIVDGIYRLSGVTSNIQKLRRTFDEDRVPALYDDEAILQDIHSVASLLKMYFRELPNPLCTYQLYDSFVQAVQADRATDDRLLRMREAVQKLPPPHYRTLEYLMRHLVRVSEKGAQTGMTARNVAIVWAPNLLRCKELEVGGVAALQGVGVQAVVTEFLIVYADLIFCSAPLPSNTLSPIQVTPRRVRPKSLAISTPTKLLSLEEAQSRVLTAGKTDQDYIEVGGGPSCLPAKYHTVIDLPRKRAGSKRSPLGWMLFFSKSSRVTSDHKNRSPAPEQRKTSIPADIVFGHEKALTESDLTSGRRRLRPVKSAESLASGQNSARSSSCLEPPSPPSPQHSAPPGHNRSVSHDSYFDTLVETPRHCNNTTLLQEEDEEGLSLSLDLSELQVNFDLEESEMRIFSEDETNQLLTSHTSLDNQGGKRQPLLAKAEDSSADPSPKKHKTRTITSSNCIKRSRLEERFSNAELRYIDSGSPEQKRDNSHVMQLYHHSLAMLGGNSTTSKTPQWCLMMLQPPLQQVQTQAEVHNSPPCDTHSPSFAEATVSENESITLSGLTTPDTPTPRPHYTRLTEDSLSDLVTTPEYYKLTPSPFPSPSSSAFDNVPRDRLSFQGDQIRPRYENVSRDRLSFQGILKNGELGLCEKSFQQDMYDNVQYENLNGETFGSITCDLTSDAMDTLIKDDEIKECSIYESVENDKKDISFYENVMSTLEDDSQLYEPVINKEQSSSYEEISGQECLISERLQRGGISSSVSLISPIEMQKENDYECLMVNYNPDDPKPRAETRQQEDNAYEDVQMASLADSLVYQQVKYLQRSVHEINQLLEESMEPFTGEDVSSLEEEETALISPMNNGTPDSVNPIEPPSESVTVSSVGNIVSSGLELTTSISRRFEEAKLESSESIDTTTVQTESVTSVSISPVVESNNIVSTYASDRDLLYENSTMDDVEAISTSYEEPGRSVEMLLDNSSSKSTQENQGQSFEMICDSSKSEQEMLLEEEEKNLGMSIDPNSKSLHNSAQDLNSSVHMNLELSDSKSKEYVIILDEHSSKMCYDNTNSKSDQESFEGHEKIESNNQVTSSNSDKDTDKQISCKLIEMDNMPIDKFLLNENKNDIKSKNGQLSSQEQKMKSQFESNSSSNSGPSSSRGNVQELLSRFEWSSNEKESLPPCLKARLSHQNSKDNTLTVTTSLDASSFPTDNSPLTRVKTSPDLNQNQESLQSPKVENSSLDSDAVRRERIEKYKEERRMFLRKKYRTDSFNNNDDKDEEMIRRLKAKAYVRTTESSEENINVPGRKDSLESMEWFSHRSPSHKLEVSDTNSVQYSRQVELESRLSEVNVENNSAKKSPSKTLVSISYSPTKTKSPGWESSPSLKSGNSSDTERLPNKIVYNRSVSLNSNPDSLRDIKNVSSDKIRPRPEDLNLLGISIVKKSEDKLSPKVIGKLDKNLWKSREESIVCESTDESLVQRRVSQLSTSSGEGIRCDSESSVKRRTSLTDLVKPQSTVRQRANSGSDKSPSYCIREMAAMFENKNVK